MVLDRASEKAHGVFQDHRHVANAEFEVSRIVAAEVRHQHGAVFIQRRGAHLQDVTLQHEVRATLHIEDAGDHGQHDRYGDRERDYQRVFHRCYKRL